MKKFPVMLIIFMVACTGVHVFLGETGLIESGVVRFFVAPIITLILFPVLFWIMMMMMTTVAVLMSSISKD